MFNIFKKQPKEVLKPCGIRSTVTPAKDIYDTSLIKSREDLVIQAMKWRKDVLAELMPSKRIQASKFYLNKLMA
jgi:hypothetical protein